MTATGTRKYRGITLIFVAMQVAVAVMLFVKVGDIQVVPGTYLALGAAVVAVIDLILVLVARNKVTTIVTSVISVLLTVAMLAGYIVVHKLDSTLTDISSGEKYETIQVSVLVLKDDTAQSLSDLAGTTVGSLKDDDGVSDVQAKINEAVSTAVTYTDYMDQASLADALLNQSARAIIMNQAYVDVLDEMEGYEGFADKVRALYTLEVKIPIKDDTSSTDSTKDGTFLVYVSGIDTYGSVNVKSRSDVNILAAVNTKTGKVQLINTPRDYYVAFPEKNNAKDKLTHAGIYGIDCSISTLEQLYGQKIDYYVRMNFSGFEGIIDAMGGIDVDSDYAFSADGYSYVKGTNHLNGAQALRFARERHSFSEGDVQRGKNQMAVITAVIKKAASADTLKNFSSIMNQLSGTFQTNMPTETMYSLVSKQLSSGTSWDVESYTVTGTGSMSTETYSMPGRNLYVMVPDQTTVDQAKTLINNVLNS